ncbi:MAG: hypothetical protein ACRBBK_08160 [Paracoccaceae bacterium]
MKQILASLSLCSLLLACGETTNPINYDTVDVEETVDETEEVAEVPEEEVLEEVVFNTLPESIGGNLNRITFNPTTETLQVDMTALDASEALATYTRTPALDQDGYLAYQVNEGNLQRTFTALTRQSDRGTVLAAVVADGGQFNRRFGGGYYARLVPLTMPVPDGTPNSGLVTYTGDYIGLFTPGASSGIPGIPSEVDTATNYRVTGDILLNASFADLAVNGAVFNRSAIDASGAEVFTLESVALIYTDIDEETGSFLGEVEFIAVDQNVIGNYGGAFAGTDASDVGGVLLINPIRDEDGMWENGAFVLGVCGMPGEGTLCAQN